MCASWAFAHNTGIYCRRASCENVQNQGKMMWSTTFLKNSKNTCLLVFKTKKLAMNIYITYRTFKPISATNIKKQSVHSQLMLLLCAQTPEAIDRELTLRWHHLSHTPDHTHVVITPATAELSVRRNNGQLQTRHETPTVTLITESKEQLTSKVVVFFTDSLAAPLLGLE